MNVQVPADPAGRLPWTSPTLPDSTHDLTEAHMHGIVDALAAADIPCRADTAYRGAGGPTPVPCHGRWHLSLARSTGAQPAVRTHPRPVERAVLIQGPAAAPPLASPT